MAIYLEIPKLDAAFPFRVLVNEGDILTTPHWHKEVEIILIRSGTVYLGIHDMPIQAFEGDIIFIGSGELHYVLASPESERLVFQFDISFFQELSFLKNTSCSLHEAIMFSEPNSQNWSEELHQHVRNLLEQIYEEATQQKDGYSYAIKGYLCLMMTLIFRELKHKDQHQMTRIGFNSNQTLEKLDEIFRYIELHYTQPLTLEEISAHVGFSSFYFTKFFKKNTGITFLTFLNEYRIEKAKWILLNENLPMLDLMERTGFSNSKTFYRLFKQITHTSPSEFKRRHL